MSRKVNSLSLCLILCVLSACATASTKLTPPVNDYCRIAQPIKYNSKQDSPATVKAIEAHNSAWVCVCEHDCPKPVS